MKNRLVPEAISAAILGIALGVLINHTHEKWHRLGRDAFLAHQAENFEKLYSRQAPWPHELLIWLLVALAVFVVFKALALLIEKIIR
jgi:hypothetical protein